MVKPIYEFTQVGCERHGVGYFIEYAGTEMASVSWSEGPAERYTERMLQAQGIVATPLVVCGMGCTSCVSVDANAVVAPQSESGPKVWFDETAVNVTKEESDVTEMPDTTADSMGSETEVTPSNTDSTEPAEVHTGSEPVANVEGTPEATQEVAKSSRKKKNAV